MEIQKEENKTKAHFNLVIIIHFPRMYFDDAEYS